MFLSKKTHSLQAAPNNNLAHRAPQGPAAAATASSDPEAAPYNSSGYGDNEPRGKLHPHSHHFPHSHHSSAFGGLPPALDAHSLDKLKSQALAKARAVQSSLIAAVKSGSGAGFGGGGGAGASTSAGSSHGGFGVVVPPAAASAQSAGAAPATAFSAFTANLGRLCDKVESSRATALACR